MANPLVIHVLWSLGRAGAERMVFDLVRTLPSQGFDTMVLAAFGGEMEADFKTAGIPLTIGPHGGPKLWERWQTVKFFERNLLELKPAIWHTHLGSDVWAGRPAFRHHVHPWILTAHSDESKLPLTTRWLRRPTMQRVDQIVCVSKGVCQSIRDTYEIPERCLSVIRSGIDLARFSSHPRTSPHTVPRILCVGRLVAGKNQATLLKALATIRHPWALSLIGEGPEETHLRALAASLHVESRVRFVGSIPDIAPYLAEADLLCFPSTSEGQGLVLLEAAASGIPIIASPLPVFKEMFNEEEVLYAFASSSKSAWAHAIEEVLDHYPAALQRANRAEQMVREHFSLEQMTKEYATLYQRLLNPS